MVKKLEMYDVSLDEIRPVTQADVDRFAAVSEAYMKLMTYIRGLEHVRKYIVKDAELFHAELVTKIAIINAGKPKK